MTYKVVGADEDGRFPPRVESHLSATYVRFVDHITGEPIPARTVVIKVDVTTGEIDDIVSEEV